MMKSGLEAIVIKNFLNGLKVAGRGLGHAYAGIIAVPIGIFQWMETDQTDRIRFIEGLDLDPRMKEDIIETRRGYQASRPSLAGYISDWYHNLRPQ